MSVGGPHRSAIALIALVLAVSAVSAPAGAGPRPVARHRAAVEGAAASAGSSTARLARSDPKLLRLRGNRPVPIMVRFDVDPIASYTGGIPGLRATSPAVAGSLRLGSTRVRSYRQYLTMPG